MEKKENNKNKFINIFLIIAIIVIIIMAYYIYIEKTTNNKKILELESTVNTMKNTIDNLQGKIDSTSNNTTNKYDTNNSSNNITSNPDISNSNENLVTEKQTLNSNGYTITLYSNNKVKITPIIKDIQNILDSVETENTKEKTYDVIGFSGNISKMYQGNNGTGVDPITFFIMEDGTVQYIQPLAQIIDNNNTIPTVFKVNEKINNLNNVIDLKRNSNDVIIAITRDGKEIKCWNQWMENM